MKEANFESYHIRKWYTQIEDSLANETGKLADGEPSKKIVIAAAIEDPAVFVSVAALHQGPPGGGPVAALVELFDD